MNFEQANELVKNIFKKPSIYGYKYTQKYSLYDICDKYPIGFVLEFYDTEMTISTVDYDTENRVELKTFDVSSLDIKSFKTILKCIKAIRDIFKYFWGKI